MPYEITQFTCHPAEVTFPPLPQPKRVGIGAPLFNAPVLQ